MSQRPKSSAITLKQSNKGQEADEDFMAAHEFFGLNTLKHPRDEYARVQLNRRLGDADIAMICRWVRDQPNGPEEFRWSRSPKGHTADGFTLFLMSKEAKTIAFGLKLKFA